MTPGASNGTIQVRTMIPYDERSQESDSPRQKVIGIQHDIRHALSLQPANLFGRDGFGRHGRVDGTVAPVVGGTRGRRIDDRWYAAGRLGEGHKGRGSGE
jgi:hypothetical protein